MSASTVSLANDLEQTAHVIEGVAQGLGALVGGARVPEELSWFLTLLEDTLLAEAHRLEGEYYRVARELGRGPQEAG